MRMTVNPDIDSAVSYIVAKFGCKSYIQRIATKPFVNCRKCWKMISNHDYLSGIACFD